MEPKKNPSKDVHRFSKHFFLIGLCISIALVITAFEWQSERKIIISDPVVHEPSFPIFPTPVTYQENKPKATPIKERPVIVDITKITVVDNPGKESSTEFPPEESIQPLHFELGEMKEIPVDTFIVVERMPVPVGGYAAFYQQLGKTIKYPSPAKRNNTEGKVFVEFVIDQNGNPINLKVSKGIGNGCDEEAIRVLSRAKWEPGNQRGHAVPVKMTMAIHFTLK
jgi:periplasmic protein TonB